MRTRLIATITTEPNPLNYSMRWVVSVSRPGCEDDPFIIWRTGNHEEAATAPQTLTEFLGYSLDEVEVRHNY